MKTLRFFLLAIAVYFASQVSGQSINAATQKHILHQLDEIREQQNLPAYGLVITNARETLLTEIRGVANAASRTPAPIDSWFRIGSITKTFVALASLRAQEEQKLSLQESVTGSLGEGYYHNPWAKQQPLQLVHLLEQTSGLRDMSKPEWDHNTSIGLDQALHQFSKQHTLSWPPGRYFSYSNTNYGLAGRLLERATGESFEDYITDKLFKPLGMTRVKLRYGDQLAQQLIPGYDTDGHTPIPYWHMIYRPLGAISLAPEDMAPLLRMFLNQGVPLLKPESIKRMETPRSSIAARAGLNYGYGLGLYDWFYKGHRFYGHGGDGDGYLAHFGYQREAGLAYFLVINAFKRFTLIQMREVVESALVEHLKRPEPSKPYILKSPQQYVGTYRKVSWRFGNKAPAEQLRLFLKGKQLYAQFGDTKGRQESAFPLIAVSDHQFRWRTQPAASMVIVETPEGWVYSGDEGNFLKSNTH